MSNRAYWIAFYTIITREIYRFIRIWPQTLLPPLLQPFSTSLSLEKSLENE